MPLSGMPTFAASLLDRVVYSLMTLYMLMILMRWLGPWLEVPLRRSPWSCIPYATEPLIRRVRHYMPALGPIDFAPVASIFIIWILRELLIKIV